MINPIIVITGPTASGKTALSLDIVPKYKGEIICVDSMTVYRGMDIGTDKPTLLEKKAQIDEDGSYTIRGIRHHLLDIMDPDEEFNCAISQKLINKIITKIHERGSVPFLVGGSTLYLDSVVYDYKMPEIKPDAALRKKLEEKTNEELFSEIAKHDPDAAWTLDIGNKRRLIRALEVIIKSGKPFSSQKKKKKLPPNVLYLAVKKEREELYGKINKRVDEMIREGFLPEVRKLFQRYDHGTAMQAAGYKQLIEYIEKKSTLREAIEKTKQAHRNYAKRQLTWLKRNSDVTWVENSVDAERAIKNFLKRG